MLTVVHTASYNRIALCATRRRGADTVDPFGEEAFTGGYVSMTAHNSAVKVIGKVKSPIFKTRSKSLAESNAHVTATTGMQTSDAAWLLRSRCHSENLKSLCGVYDKYIAYCSW
jgi:hypothetical protein